MPLPPWLAAIVQVPVETSVTVVPETVHTDNVCDEKVTVSPEVAVADTPNGGEDANDLLLRVPNVMVWFAVATTKLCVTSGAIA